MNDGGTGVVNTGLRFKAYDNLYACDVSVFPFIPAANPALRLRHSRCVWRWISRLHSPDELGFPGPVSGMARARSPLDAGADIAPRHTRSASYTERTIMDSRRASLLLLLLLVVPLSGCQAIATIFEAGMWIGVIMVVLVLAIVGFIVSRVRRP